MEVIPKDMELGVATDHCKMDPPYSPCPPHLPN